MEPKTVRNDLDFLVNNPRKTHGSVYHDAGSCWLLIDIAAKEIRKLRKKLADCKKSRATGVMTDLRSPLYFFAFCSSPWLRSLLLASLACLARGERLMSRRSIWPPNSFSAPVFSAK